MADWRDDLEAWLTPFVAGVAIAVIGFGLCARRAGGQTLLDVDLLGVRREMTSDT